MRIGPATALAGPARGRDLHQGSFGQEPTVANPSSSVIVAVFIDPSRVALEAGSPS